MSPPPTDTGVEKFARYLGRTIPAAQFGDFGDHSFYWQFTAPVSGKLYDWIWYTQGARPNCEWGDRHALGNYGRYELHVYEVPAPSPTTCNRFGSEPTDNKWLGQSGDFWPGRIVGGFDGQASPRYDASGWTNSYANSQSAASGVLVGSAGAQFQAYNTKTDNGFLGSNWGKSPEAQQKIDQANPMPSDHTSKVLYCGTGWVRVPLKSKDASQALTVDGIDLVKGRVYLVHYKNIGTNPNDNECHDNQFMADDFPCYGTSADVPGDPHLAMYGVGGARDWRRLPAINYRIGSEWFGNAGMMSRGNTENFTLITGDTQVRQQWTPVAGYSENFGRVRVHVLRRSGGNYVDGALQFRLLRAAQDTTAWSVLSSTGWVAPTTAAPGWSDFPTGVAASASSLTRWGDSKNSNPGTAARKFLEADLPSVATVERGYHYVLELRAKDNSTTIGYWICDAIGVGNRFNRTRATGVAPLYPKGVFPCLDDGTGKAAWELRNGAQVSTNKGSAWSTLYQAGTELTVCLEPHDSTEPTVTLKADKTSGALPLEVKFTGTTTASPVTAWAWDFGDGTTSAEQNPTKTFETAGKYDVKLTVTTAEGSFEKAITGYINAGNQALRGLPVLATWDFNSEQDGLSWSKDEESIKSTLALAADVTGTLYGIDPAWQPRNREDVSVAKAGDHYALRVKYPERTSTYTQGGGAGIVLQVGTTGACTDTTGYKKAAAKWEVYVPKSFSNWNGGIKPFKMNGMVGGYKGSPPGATPWSDGQGGTKTSNHGFSLRFQGTGDYRQSNGGVLKPYPNVTDDRAPWPETAYGRWEPDFTRVVLTKDGWSTCEVYFEGNTKDKHDGKLRYYVNGTEIFSDDAVQFRPYASRCWGIWICTFFGGNPSSDASAGSPQDQYLYFRNFQFAGSN